MFIILLCGLILVLRRTRESKWINKIMCVLHVQIECLSLAHSLFIVDQRRTI